MTTLGEANEAYSSIDEDRASYQEEYDTSLRQWAWKSLSENLTTDKRFELAEKLYKWVKTGKQ